MTTPIVACSVLSNFVNSAPNVVAALLETEPGAVVGDDAGGAAWRVDGLGDGSADVAAD
jgi:hypothetical protein